MYDMTVAAELSAENKTQYIVCITISLTVSNLLILNINYKKFLSVFLFFFNRRTNVTNQSMDVLPSSILTQKVTSLFFLKKYVIPSIFRKTKLVKIKNIMSLP